MSSNAQRFAQLALDAFAEYGHTTDELVHQAGGPSSTYMTGLRKAAEGSPMKEPRSDTYRRIEAAAGWKRGSAKTVWHGGEPVVMSNDTMIFTEGREPRYVKAPLPARVRRYSHDLEGWVERLVDRVLDLEERVDALEEAQSLIGEEGEDRGDAAPNTQTRKPLVVTEAEGVQVMPSSVEAEKGSD